MLKYTIGDSHMQRADFWYSRPLADGWKVGVGGFYRVDKGIRAPGFSANDGGQIRLKLDGEPVPLLEDSRVGAADQWLEFAWAGDGKPHWIRGDVRDANGRLLLLGNPIYLN
jgi:hypothetical protein